MSDFFHDYIQSVVRPLANVDVNELGTLFAELEAAANRDLTTEGITDDRRQIQRSLDLRYMGQNSEIGVPLGDGSGDLLAFAASEFHRLHHALYSYSVPDEPIQLVNLRVRAVGIVPRPPLATAAVGTGAATPYTRRAVHLPDERRTVEVAIYRRGDLASGRDVAGPAIIEEASSSTFLPTGTTAVVDRFDNLVVDVSPL